MASTLLPLVCFCVGIYLFYKTPSDKRMLLMIISLLALLGAALFEVDVRI